MGYIPQNLIARYASPRLSPRFVSSTDYLGFYLRIVFAIIGVIVFFIILLRILWWCRVRNLQNQQRQAEDVWWWQRWQHNQWQWNQRQAELQRQRDIHQRQVIHQRNLDRQERWRQQRETQRQQREQRQRQQQQWQRNTTPNMGTIPTPQPAVLRMHFVTRPQPPPSPPPINFALLVVNVPTGESDNQASPARTAPTTRPAEGITRVGSDNTQRNQHQRAPSRSQTRTPGGSDRDPPPAYKP
ncbi:hypothetical protein TWF694_006455 [Orbilia ellipsospora]|uniref:Uncharacterized protein n=1 Tax=Orbilia ellipsospora TaxID=2528407 RepID=A0AAV9XKJ5_9PEZI